MKLLPLTHCAVCTWVLAMVVWVTYLVTNGDVKYLARHSLSYDYIYSNNTAEIISYYYQRRDTGGFLDAVGFDKLSKNTSEGVMLREKLQEYENKIYRVRSSKEQCTMVIQTYKRTQILPRVIRHYCTMVIFHKVLIIWNDVNATIPASLTKMTKMCSALVEFVVPKENRLTNRFVPRKEIETDCVCLSDDDRIVNSEDISFGFDVWKNFRQRLVGFEERSVLPGANNTFKYAFHQRKKSDVTTFGSWSKSYSIMLMTACFVHKTYLEIYFDPYMMPVSILDYVNKEKNCEDILLSVVVTKFLQDISHSQCGVIMVMEKHRITNLDDDRSLKGYVGLRTRGNHYERRSICLNKFAKVFGYLPLKTSRIMVMASS